MTRKNIDRRRFLKTTGTGLAGLTLLPGMRWQDAGHGESTALRLLASLDHNWLYLAQAEPNATGKVFNENGFQRVTIPHTNKMLPWHGFDDHDYEFVSIYRRHFRLPGERMF